MFPLATLIALCNNTVSSQCEKLPNPQFTGSGTVLTSQTDQTRKTNKKRTRKRKCHVIEKIHVGLQMEHRCLQMEHRCNTGRLVAFLLVLGEGVEGAFLKECVAAYLRFPTHVVNKIRQGGGYCSEGWCCKKHLNTTNYERRTRVYNPNPNPKAH